MEYAGAGIGATQNSFSIVNPAHSHTPIGGGVDVGIQGGYQKSFGKIVLGAEASVDYADAAYNQNGVKLDHDMTYGVKLRPGYKILPSTALFATGGVALASIELNNGTIDHTQSQFGYTAGAGVETFVTDHIAVRADYEHGFFGHYTVSTPGIGNSEIKTATDTVKLGVDYHF